MELSALPDQPCTSQQARQQLQEFSTPSIVTHFNCKVCSFTTTSEAELKLHSHKEHFAFQHICILCSKTFTTPQELGRHSRICRPSTMVSPKEIKQTSQLSEMLTEQGVKVWQCDLCDFR